MKISDSEAIEIIQNKEVVALPTDTLYGLMARFDCERAVEKIFSLKNRPRNNPMIVLAGDIPSFISLTAGLPESTLELAYAFWPGPLTLILPADLQKIPSIVRAGKDTCAFRIPANESLLTILRETGPLVAPSANLSGNPPMTSASEIEHEFGPDFPVVENSSNLLGIESTILSFSDEKWNIIRKGVIESKYFEPVLGYIPTEKKIQSYSLDEVLDIPSKAKSC